MRIFGEEVPDDPKYDHRLTKEELAKESVIFQILYLELIEPSYREIDQENKRIDELKALSKEDL